MFGITRRCIREVLSQRSLGVLFTRDFTGVKFRDNKVDSQKITGTDSLIAFVQGDS